MENHFVKFTQWLKTQQLDTVTKQNLLHEVIRRARTTETVSPWYRRFSLAYVPATVMAVCTVLFISYNSGTSPTVTLPTSTSETGTHEYQVLSAYEHADKIAKEKASLQKIINTLPTETVSSTVTAELQNIEKYMQKTNTETTTETEPKKDPEPIITPKLELPTQEIITDTKEKVSEYYEKIKTSQEKGDLAETLILIGEVKKIIADEQEPITPDSKTTTPTEKDTQKKQ